MGGQDGALAWVPTAKALLSCWKTGEQPPGVPSGRVGAGREELERGACHVPGRGLQEHYVTLWGQNAIIKERSGCEGSIGREEQSK